MVGRRRGEAGMTLLELMLSLALISLMMFLAWSTATGTARIKRNLEETQRRNHEIRVGIERMVRDLSAAYISGNENQALQERRTLLVGKPASTVDELRFTSLAHTPLWANADESEQTMIEYFDEDDPDDSSKTNLLRRELRRLPDEGDTYREVPAEIDVLLHNVERVKFEYWDWRDKEWKERWDTTSADAERNRLPTRVKITVVIKARDGDSITYTTQARLMMQEQLNLLN